ncbi:sodium/potassium/calcium exchanger 1-like [Haliotis rufescens]|uniref:sodium/potassium/calcium exchanger 1-like n=1 Tax=Haliotis rufescens TaxID=6454 RepID=UPI00201F182F|nr:sodium/potassium/calcium exchanger 1-like [Haliotis rufescens]XP_048240711.1 sodium/potassium/calcium exchanger 1-like [Haliotis rufescens]
MPSNKDFTMSILVGGVELPEYTKDGTCFVESNLFTPVSYNVHLEEEVQGETEAQSWPVTPYQIRVAAKSNTPYSYYKIYVDGQKASQVAVHPGKHCISEGFYDGSQITEFLFSLPRFPKNEKDRIEKGKASRIGVLEVECWNSKVTGYKKPITHDVEYSQANKKDSSNVTQGKYMMATTKMGRSLRTTQKSLVEDWTLFNVRSKLSVKYVMGHSLVDMGFKLKPIRIPIHRIPASVVHQTTSVAKRKKPGPLSKKFPVPSPSIQGSADSEVIEIDSDESDEEVIVGDVLSSKKQKLGDTINVDESMASEADNDEPSEGTSGDMDIKTEAIEDGDKEDGDKEDGDKEDGDKEDGDKKDGDKEDGSKEAESKDDDSKSDNNEENMETEGSKDDAEDKDKEDEETEAGGDGKESGKEEEPAKSGEANEVESGDGDEKGESEDNGGKGDAERDKGEDGDEDKPADSGEGSKEGDSEPGKSGDAPDAPELKGDEESRKEDEGEASEEKQADEDRDNGKEGQENGGDSDGQNDSTENKDNTSENTDMKCSDDNMLDIDLFCALNDIDDCDNDAALLD